MIFSPVSNTGSLPPGDHIPDKVKLAARAKEDDKDG